MRALLPFAAAVAFGLAQALAIALPWTGQPQWWLQLLSLAGLAFLIRRSTSWLRAAGLAWVFATAWLTGTFWWLFISMHVYGGLAPPLAALAVLGLAAFLGSYYAAAGATMAALRFRSPWADALVFASCWLAAELLRATWFTGFPWGAGGYAHVDGPLAALAPYVGVYGIGFVAALLAFALAQFAEPARGKRDWWRPAAVTAVLALGVWALQARPGIDAIAGTPAGRLDVALLQGNIPQDEKFEGGTGIPVALEWYGSQLQGSTASLVVAPETAIPMLPSQLPDGYYDALLRRFSQGRQAALIGIPMGGFREGYTNTVIGIAPGAAPYRFDKHHLVPFGEFIPPFFKWFTRMMNIPLGDFDRGPLPQRPFEWMGQRLGPNICYEDLFGEELGAQFADAGAAPTIFVNVSNIAWFGNSVAIDQHLHISRMRALEFERPMIRATNTGATVIIDHRGRVTHSLARHTRGVLNGSVEGRTTITPFAWWISRAALWPLWLLAIGVPAIASIAWQIRALRLGN